MKEPKKLEYENSPRSGLSKIYQIHKYWGRKPWKPVYQLIRENSEEGDLIVDLFLGSGVMALESIAQGRNFIGFDINPMSKFITENTLKNDFDKVKFDNDLKKIKDELENFFLELYSAEEDYCEKCGRELISVHYCIGPKNEGEEKGKFYCYDCGRSSYQKKRELTTRELKKSNKKYDFDYWIPERKFPEDFLKDRFSYKGVDSVADLYTNRNLFALAKLRHTLKSLDLNYPSLFILAFSNTVLHSSKLKGENVRPLGVNNYWIPDDYIEENVWMRFLERVERVKKSKKKLIKKINSLRDSNKKGKWEIHTKSATSTDLESESVDYIITDPPYGKGIQYFELSFVWNTWMQSEFDREKEIIVNPKRGKSKEDFIRLLRKAIDEASRILKRDGKITLCFQNKKFEIWNDVLEIFRENDLVLEDVVIVETLGNTYNNNWSDFSPEHDIYLTFQKSSFKGFKKDEKLEIKDLLKSIIRNGNSENPAEVYDKLAATLIWEIFYNEYNLDVSNLTIKKLSETIKNFT